MTRIKGTLSYSSNYEPHINRPLDARNLVSSYSDLINPTTWEGLDSNEYIYVGIIVCVSSGDKSGLYRLVNIDYTQESNWSKISFEEDNLAYLYTVVTDQDNEDPIPDVYIAGIFYSLGRVRNDNNIYDIASGFITILSTDMPSKTVPADYSKKYNVYVDMVTNELVPSIKYTVDTVVIPEGNIPLWEVTLTYNGVDTTEVTLVEDKRTRLVVGGGGGHKIYSDNIELTKSKGLDFTGDLQATYISADRTEVDLTASAKSAISSGKNAMHLYKINNMGITY